MRILLLKFVLESVLVLLLVGHGFGDEWPAPPVGQPVQMRSEVIYDPKISDPFFESEKWTSSNSVQEDVNGRIVDTGEECPSGNKWLGCEQNTARFISSRMWEHTMEFCRARLFEDGTIELFIHNDRPPIHEYLKIVIQKGVFWSQYWFHPKRSKNDDELPTWRTKRQQLSLEKHVYHKGDVIKGRLDFECAGNAATFSPDTITVTGVFKTILK